MEFESPDVERDFPGLYASESGKRSDGSDFSDDSHEKVSKKDLLIGKRKEKKDSKKDRGYATLEGESSPEEDTDIKSPSKSKKSKTFKFSTKKEKREKSREKDVKDKDFDKDKDKKKSDDKEKKKDKVKLRLKDKKKSKQEDSCDIEELPIFGVPLVIATERSKCHDGVAIPLIVRHCIDRVQQTGLTAENVYKVSGIKSRVQQVKRLYNQGEPVSLLDYDLPIATSLLKLFLRELPEPLLTKDLLGKFEEASSIDDSSQRVDRLKSLVAQLPICNRTTLAWLIRHFDSVCNNEKSNKMSILSLSTALSPAIQASQRTLSALLINSSSIFPQVTLTKYVPPQTSNSLSLPDDCGAITCEIKKQESLLEQLHSEMNHGWVSRAKEEQLWDVQRVITQLKRKLRSLERASGICSGQRSLDDTDSSLRYEVEDINMRLKSNEHQSPIPAPRQNMTRISPPQESLAPSAVNSVPIPAPRQLESKQEDSCCDPHQSLPLEAQRGEAWSIREPKSLPPETWSATQESGIGVDQVVWNSNEARSLSPESNHLQDHLAVESSRVPSEKSIEIRSCPEQSQHHESYAPPPPLNHFKSMTAESLEVEDINRTTVEMADKRQLALLQTEELTNVIINLRALCQLETKEITRIKNRILQLGGHPDMCDFKVDNVEEEEGDDSCFESNIEKNGIVQKRMELLKETRRLQKQKDALVKSICEECDACIDLRVYIKHLKMSNKYSLVV